MRVLRRGASATMRAQGGRRRGADFQNPRLTRPGRRPAAAGWLLVVPVIRGFWRGGRALTLADRVGVQTFLVLCACECVSVCVCVCVCVCECVCVCVCVCVL